MEELSSPLSCPAPCCKQAWPQEGAQLHVHCAWTVPGSCSCLHGGQVNALHRTFSWLSVCSPNSPPVGSCRLPAAGRRTSPEISQHSGATAGLKLGWRVTHLCLTGVSQACEKTEKVAPCGLVGFWVRGVAVFAFFMLCLCAHCSVHSSRG